MPVQGPPGTRAAAGLASSWIHILDPELGQENLAEAKAIRLTLNRGVDAKDLRPGAAERARLEAVLAQPPARTMTIDERTLLWVFRCVPRLSPSPAVRP